MAQITCSYYKILKVKNDLGEVKKFFSFIADVYNQMANCSFKNSCSESEKDEHACELIPTVD